MKNKSKAHAEGGQVYTQDKPGSQDGNPGQHVLGTYKERLLMALKKKPASQNKAVPGVSRRGFIRAWASAAGPWKCSNRGRNPSRRSRSARVAGPGAVPITLQINGKPYKLMLEPRVTLLDALRDHLDLTGAKRVCDRGNCGACTVIMAGKAVYACSVLAIEAQGKPIQTIEGLATRRAAASRIGGLRAQRRPAVRLLHAWAS